MGKRILLVVFLLSFFALFVFAGGALGANKPSRGGLEKASVVYPTVDGKETRSSYSGPTPLMYEGGKDADCFDIHPDQGTHPVVVLEHDQWGATYYDYQKNGSMGRMIAVTAAGQREMMYMYLGGYPYNPSTGPNYRSIYYNCKDALGSWCCAPIGEEVHGGQGNNAGYVNIAAMHDGREAIIYHTSGLLSAGVPNATALAIGDPGFACNINNNWANKYDIPDAVGGTEEASWPKMEIVYDPSTDIDYMHIVATEGKTSGGNQRLGYVRCHLLPGDTLTFKLVCETPWGQTGVDSVDTILPNTTTTNKQIAYFGQSEAPGVGADQYPNTISVIAAPSPVSKKIAIVFTNKREKGNIQVNNDVFYFESTNNGESWFPQHGGQWPPTIANGMLHNVSNYLTTDMERAYTDVAACYDYNDNLHIVWSSCYYDSVGGYVSADANLYHWSQATGISVVAPGYWDQAAPGGWNRNVSKMSISAKDPIYHPGGSPDSVYLFVTWTQFNGDNRDKLDNSLDDRTNGEIYAAVSNNAGLTWTPGYDLTGTHTDSCALGNCLSEHWSTLAQNIYDGDLHIEYVCDKDAGGIVQSEGGWTYNPMMYMRVQQPDWYLACGEDYINMNPANWSVPPLKVPSDPGYRIISFWVRGIYNLQGDYKVVSGDPTNVAVTLNPGPATLQPGDKLPVEITITCPGDTLLETYIYIVKCMGTAREDTTKIPLLVVCGDDYYECVRDPATKFGAKNGALGAYVCSLWVCSNSREELFDMRLPTDSNQVIFSAGAFAAFMDDSAIVGRQDYRDTRTGARDTVRHIKSHFPEYPDCDVQKIFVTKTYVWYPPEIPQTPKWYWLSINKQILFLYDSNLHPPAKCPDWTKELVVKHVWINYSGAPAWWPNEGSYLPDGHPDIYYGMYADIDAPFDTGCHVMGGEAQSGCNAAGWDPDNKMVWQSGFGNIEHPTWANYHVGMALTNASGAIVTPLGCKDVMNSHYLYPNDGWGWQDSQLYRLATTPLNEGSVVDNEDSVVDRSVVMTAGMIPAGSTTNFLGEFILIEALSPTNLDSLKSHIVKARTILMPDLYKGSILEKSFSGKCGDIALPLDGNIDATDIVYLQNYLYIHGPRVPWCVADVNGDGNIDAADVVCLQNYLYIHGPVCNCFGCPFVD
jgi:hypothetical protein